MTTTLIVLQRFEIISGTVGVASGFGDLFSTDHDQRVRRSNGAEGQAP
jgi:hypothetical protein